MRLVAAAMTWADRHREEWIAARERELIDREKHAELARIEMGKRTGVGPSLVEAGRDAIGKLRDASAACEYARVDLMRAAQSCWIDVLGMNLAVAGALCAAYTAGDDAARDIYWGNGNWWSPGCGRMLVLT